MRSVRYVTAHRGAADSFQRSPLFRSIGEREPLFARLNNSEGLSKVYNRFLDREYEQFTCFGTEPEEHLDNDIVVFIHDDVEMIGNNCVSELNRWADAGYAILGLAGGARAVIKSPALWNLMTEQGTRSGNSIFHIVPRDPFTGKALRDPVTGRLKMDREQPSASTFGLFRDVVILDGLFLAAVLDTVEPSGWRFDERFNFHHYDLSACLRAHTAGLKMRTVCIPVIHWSPGLESMNDEFRNSERTFLQAYAPNGPVRVTC